MIMTLWHINLLSKAMWTMVPLHLLRLFFLIFVIKITHSNNKTNINKKNNNSNKDCNHSHKTQPCSTLTSQLHSYVTMMCTLQHMNWAKSDLEIILLVLLIIVVLHLYIIHSLRLLLLLCLRYTLLSLSWMTQCTTCHSTAVSCVE